MIDDRFRTGGSRFEHEKAVAIAVVPREAKIDWSDPAHAPENTLWLPMTIFEALARVTLLGRLPQYQQSRLSPAECRQLAEQLAGSSSSDPDVRVAAVLVREMATSVEGTDALVLLVEGPSPDRSASGIATRS